MIPALLFLALGGAGPSPLPAPLAPPGAADRENDEVHPLERLRVWTERVARRGPAELEAGWRRALRHTVADLETHYARAEGDQERREILGAFLDLAGLTVPGRGERPPAIEDARSLGLSALEKRLESDDRGLVVPWIAQDLLGRPGSQPYTRRVTAVRFLAGRHLPGTQLALFSCVSRGEPELRAAAVDALAGWTDPTVHRFLVNQLERRLEDEEWLPEAPLREHFESARLHGRSPVRERLRAYCSRRLASHDWRKAVKGLRFLSGLDDAIAVPALIEGLEVWIDRRAHGSGSKRVEGDTMNQLQRRSGLHIGPFPERWKSWWEALRTGRIPSGPREARAQATRVSFFGLRPYTDRVLFVIDRSGSMNEPFGTGGRSRFEEATKQMMEFLRSVGSDTQFRVVLFDDKTRVWNHAPRRATTTDLEHVGRFLAANDPEGGTYLMPALKESLFVRRDGSIDLGRLKVDTVIVLCDGETAQGPAWVEEFLEEVNEHAMLVFHCVQIGAAGNGTLEALADGTGGQFVKSAH